MMNTTRMVLLSMCIAVSFTAGCVKKNAEEPIPPNAILKDSANPDQVIVDTVVNLPKQMRSKAKPLDVLVWDVKDNQGAMVAMGMMDVEKFPIRLKVQARDLVRPLDPKSPIGVYVRLVKLGDEDKPPQKGQLVGYMGAASGKSEKIVVPDKISRKTLARAERRFGVSDSLKELAVGDRAEISLQPYQF